MVYRGKDYVPPSVRQVQEREEAERKKLMSLGVDEVEEGEAGEKVEGEEDGVFRESAPVEVSGQYVFLLFDISCRHGEF